MWWSWVAISTVVPVRLIRSSRSMMSLLVSGSRLPVGSSASSTSGRLTNARAIATRCCSPPDSSCGSRLALPDRPDHLEHLGHHPVDRRRARLPITSSANATFSNTVFCCSSRKSWNTQPITCRRLGMCRPGSLLTWNFDTRMSPVVGCSSAEQQPHERRLARTGRADEEDELTLVDLDETLSSAGRADDLYCLLTWSRVIITARQCSGERWPATLSYRGGAAMVGAGPGPGCGGAAPVTGSGSSSAGRRRRQDARRPSAARTAASVVVVGVTGGVVGAGSVRGGRRRWSACRWRSPAAACTLAARHPGVVRGRARSPAAPPAGAGGVGGRFRAVGVVDPAQPRRTRRSTRRSTCAAGRRTCSFGQRRSHPCRRRRRASRGCSGSNFIASAPHLGFSIGSPSAASAAGTRVVHQADRRVGRGRRCRRGPAPG